MAKIMSLRLPEPRSLAVHADKWTSSSSSSSFSDRELIFTMTLSRSFKGKCFLLFTLWQRHVCWPCEEINFRDFSLSLLIGRALVCAPFRLFMCGMHTCGCVYRLHVCAVLTPSPRCQVHSLAGRANNERSEHPGAKQGLRHTRQQEQHKLKNIFILYWDTQRYIRNYQAPRQKWCVYVKVCLWGAKRFCHLHSAVRFPAKLLPRMRVNYPHSSESFPRGCLFLWCLCWHANKWGSAHPQVQHCH